MCVLRCESFLAAVSGVDCMDWQPGELSLIPATAVDRTALNCSCLKTSLGPACCKLFTKQRISQLERVYHEPLISPPITPALYQSALAGHLQSWRKLLLTVTHPCVHSLLHRCCFPLCNDKGLNEHPLFAFAFGTHLPTNTTTVLLRFE